jgi:hypothetical protein
VFACTIRVSVSVSVSVSVALSVRAHVRVRVNERLESGCEPEGEREGPARTLSHAPGARPRAHTHTVAVVALCGSVCVSDFVSVSARARRWTAVRGAGKVGRRRRLMSVLGYPVCASLVLGHHRVCTRAMLVSVLGYHRALTPPRRWSAVRGARRSRAAAAAEKASRRRRATSSTSPRCRYVCMCV